MEVVEVRVREKERGEGGPNSRDKQARYVGS